MNQPSMKDLMARMKLEKQQKAQAIADAQAQQQLTTTLLTSHISPVESPQPQVETTTLPMTSPITKLPTPVLPQSFVERINQVSCLEVDEYLSTTMPDLYARVGSSMAGGYREKLYDEPDYVYIQNFLSPHEELVILTIINSTPQSQWSKLSKRSLIMYGGTVESAGLKQEELPRWLLDLFNKIESYGIIFHPHLQTKSTPDLDQSTDRVDASDSPSDPVRPNHVLLNYYSVGDQIMPHKDGPAYSPQAVIISLLSSLTLSYWTTLADAQRDGIVGAKLNFYVEPRSLFIMKNMCYNDLLHGIDGVGYDPILTSHINRNRIEYTHQFIGYDEFLSYLAEITLIRGDSDPEVVRYRKMVDQIKLEEMDLKTNSDTIPPRHCQTISQRCERLSLTIRRVDPILPTHFTSE